MSLTGVNINKRLLSTARQTFSEVSKAFFVLSNDDRRAAYDKSNVISEPAKHDKKHPPSNEYFVQHNGGSVTIHIPTGSDKHWTEAIESHYNMSTEDKGKNGRQLNVPFHDPETNDEIGSVTLHVYHTSKILVQGSAYYLWVMFIYEHLKEQLLATSPTTEVMCEDIICNKCQQPGPEDEGVIQCNSCQQWYHYVCTGLRQSLLYTLITDEEREYVCNQCSHDDQQSEETTPKAVYSAPNLEDNNNNAQLSSLQISVDKLESILMSRITTDNDKFDTLAARISRMEIQLSKTKDPPVENLARLSDIEVLKRRINALEAENKNLRNRITLLEQQSVKKAGPTTSQTGDSARAPRTPETTNTRFVPNIPTNNSFEVLADNTPMTQVERKLDSRDNGQSQTRPTERRSDDPILAEIVIIGDSNTRGIVPSVLYPGKLTAKHSAMKVPQAIELITETNYSDPKCIVYHVGTNDIREERAANGVTENLRQLVTTTRSKYPNADIVMSAIPPRNDKQLMEVTRDVNTFLHILHQETAFISLADNDNLGEDGSIKRALYKQDGYHLNRDGLKVLAANWKTAIHPLVGMGTYNRGQRWSTDPSPTNRQNRKPGAENNQLQSSEQNRNRDWTNPGSSPREEPNPNSFARDRRPREEPNPNSFARDRRPREEPNPNSFARDRRPREEPNPNSFARDRRPREEPNPNSFARDRRPREEPNPNSFARDRRPREEPNPNSFARDRLPRDEPYPNSFARDRLPREEPNPNSFARDRRPREEPNPNSFARDRLHRDEPYPNSFARDRLPRDEPNPNSFTRDELNVGSRPRDWTNPDQRSWCPRDRPSPYRVPEGEQRQDWRFHNLDWLPRDQRASNWNRHNADWRTYDTDCRRYNGDWHTYEADWRSHSRDWRMQRQLEEFPDWRYNFRGW
ncbi:G-protein coupled receptor [Branchiostoma belcheri]|nr:G-protein coupled receptor [Branchiostoma belcheri]